MPKTFEVGKCYLSHAKDESYGKYFLVVVNFKDYGYKENAFMATPYFIGGTFQFVSWRLWDSDFDRYEECIVEDLQVGDKVLLRNGTVAEVDCRGNPPMPIRLKDFGWYFENGTYDEGLREHDIIAILERAKDKIRDLDRGRYKLPNGDIIEVE